MPPSVVPLAGRLNSFLPSPLIARSASELKSGTLEFRRLNVEEPPNRHFATDFKLYTRSLVIVRYSGDKVEQYKNLTRVWELVQSPQEFREYVRTEIRKFMGGRS